MTVIVPELDQSVFDKFQITERQRPVIEEVSDALELLVSKTSALNDNTWEDQRPLHPDLYHSFCSDILKIMTNLEECKNAKGVTTEAPPTCPPKPPTKKVGILVE